MPSERDVLIAALAKLIGGLHAPVSLGVPIGVARAAYDEVREAIGDFGWSKDPEIEARLRAVLDAEVQR